MDLVIFITGNMSFTESVKTCVQEYAVFEGRASRSEYWYWQIIAFFTVFVVSFISASEAMGHLVNLALLLPCIAVAVRRMHYTGHSGWCAIILLFNIFLCFISGDEGANEYGEDPLDYKY